MESGGAFDGACSAAMPHARDTLPRWERVANSGCAIPVAFGAISTGRVCSATLWFTCKFLWQQLDSGDMPIDPHRFLMLRQQTVACCADCAPAATQLSPGTMHRSSNRSTAPNWRADFICTSFIIYRENPCRSIKDRCTRQYFEGAANAVSQYELAQRFHIAPSAQWALMATPKIKYRYDMKRDSVRNFGIGSA